MPLKVGSQNHLLLYLLNWYYIEKATHAVLHLNMLYYFLVKAHANIALKNKSVGVLLYLHVKQPSIFPLTFPCKICLNR